MERLDREHRCFGIFMKIFDSRRKRMRRISRSSGRSSMGTGPSKIQFRDFSRSPRSRDNLPAGIKFPSGSIAARIFIEYFACRCVYTRVPRPFLQTYVPIYTTDHKCQHVYWCLIFSVNSNIRTIKNIKIQKNDICMLYLCCFYILAILFLPLQRAF